MRSHVLPEPTLPVGRTPSIDENRAVARALAAFAATSPQVAPLEAFTADHPDSPWRASVLANLGTLRWREGYFSRAAHYWDESWTLPAMPQLAESDVGIHRDAREHFRRSTPLCLGVYRLRRAASTG